MVNQSRAREGGNKKSVMTDFLAQACYNQLHSFSQLAGTAPASFFSEVQR